jgi:hypothetical protein
MEDPGLKEEKAVSLAGHGRRKAKEDVSRE